MTRSFYNVLARERACALNEWTPGICHAKMSVADDARLATCGTINLDYRSLYHHFENGCFMTDVPAVLSIKEDFDETFSASVAKLLKSPAFKWSAPQSLESEVINAFCLRNCL